MNKKNIILALLVLIISTSSLFARDVQVTFKNSSDVIITSDMTLKVYDGGWRTIAGFDGDETISVTNASVRYVMYYKNGVKTITSTDATVGFTTVSVTPKLENVANSPLTGGIVKYYQNGWSGSLTANTSIEMLAGTYQFKMYFANGIETKLGEVINGTTDEVKFTTVSVTPKLENVANSPLTGGIVKYYQNGWSGSLTANTSIEMLAGTYQFKMYFANGIETKLGEVIDGTDDEVIFTTVSVTPKLVDSDGAELSGGVATYYQNGWSGSLTANVALEMLAGTYQFKMYYAKGVETKLGEVIDGTDDEVIFTTHTVIPELLGFASVELSGIVKYYQNGWSANKNTNEALNMLKGSYQFKMYYNYGIETYYDVQIPQAIAGKTEGTNSKTNKGATLLAGDGSEVSCQTVLLKLTYDGTIKFHQNGWGTYSDVAVGGGMHFMPGDYTFRFYSKDGKKYYETPVTICSETNKVTIFGEEWDADNCKLDKQFHVFQTKKADGTPLANINISREDYSNHYVKIGTTNDDGFLLLTNMPEGSWKYKAYKDHTTQYFTSEASLITFQTAKFIAHVKDTDGEDFAGLKTFFQDYNNHWILLSPTLTDANGNASIELFPGSYKFKAYKDHTAQIKTLEITKAGKTGTVEFQTATFTTNVNHTNGDDFAGVKTFFQDYNNHWLALSSGLTDVDGNATIELFPGTYTFKAYKDHTEQIKTLVNLTSGSTETVSFQTATFTTNVNHTNGDDFAGIRTFYYDYNNHWLALSSGLTDVDGNATIELFPGTYTFRAYKDHTEQIKTLANLTSGNTETVEFQTATAVAVVKDCDTDEGIAGIRTYYYDYNNHWLALSSGVTDADGKASIELFPGTYDLKAVNIKTQQIKPITLTASGVTTEVEFNPTRVNFHYAGKVGYNDYSSHWFRMNDDNYMFPGTYKFKFDNFVKEIEIDGCSHDYSLAIVSVLASDKTRMDGIDISYYNGSWHAAGTTGDSGDGYLFVYTPGSKTNLKFRAEDFNGKNEVWQNIATNQYVVFETPNPPFTVNFVNSEDTGYEGIGVDYYGNHGWKCFGEECVEGNRLMTTDANGNIQKDILAGAYKFRIKYAGATQEFWQTVKLDVPETHTVNFKTELVTVELDKSGTSGDAPADADVAIVQYYASGWKTFGTDGTLDADGIATMELLPVNYKFRVKYKGASQEFWHNVATQGTHVKFQTVLTVVELDMSGISGDAPAEAEGEAVKYYAGGWKAYGVNGTLDANGTATMELLPVNYKWRVSYKGASQEFWQNVATDITVDFQTVNVIMTVKKSDAMGGEGINGADLKYYASGWKTFGDGISGNDPAGQEKMELLPVNYKWRVTLLGQSEEKWQTITTTATDVIFEVVNPTATVKLLDSDDNGLADGEAWYYARGWKKIGLTDGNGEVKQENLLQGNYKFRMIYKGGRKEFWHRIKLDDATTHTVTFNTVEVTVNLKDSDNETPAGTNGEVVQYYASGWKSFGTLNTTGTATMELLPVNYKWRVYYESGRKEFWQNIATDETVDFTTTTVTCKYDNGDPSFKYYASGWHDFGTGNSVVKEMLPINYKFKCTKDDGTTNSMWYSVTGESCTVDFSSNFKMSLDSDNAWFSVKEVYPNPACENTMIEFNTPEDGNVRVIIFNSNGEMVKELYNATMTQGAHSINWNVTNTNGYSVPNGVYFIHITNEENVITKSVSVVR